MEPSRLRPLGFRTPIDPYFVFLVINSMTMGGFPFCGRFFLFSKKKKNSGIEEIPIDCTYAENDFEKCRKSTSLSVKNPSLPAISTRESLLFSFFPAAWLLHFICIVTILREKVMNKISYGII